jgi:chromate reductase, NAD(P)H dehydrogenase (quinone)
MVSQKCLPLREVSRGEDGNPSRSAFWGKKFGLISASPGSKGGRNGLIHLKEIIQNIGGEVAPLQVSVPNV